MAPARGASPVTATAKETCARDLPDAPRQKLSWEDVRILEAAGLHEIAEIARCYLNRKPSLWSRILGRIAR